MSSDAIVQALVKSYATGDPDIVGYLAPGSTIWFNHTKEEHDARESFGNLGALRDMVEGLRMDVVEQLPTPAGAVLRVVIRGTVKVSGNELASYNCIIVRIQDGQLTRLEEYVDPTLGQQLNG